MRTLAIIPARGGSKGIPRKNLRPLAGKPLLAWAIGAALDAESVDCVVVSTDSDEIARVARRFGARALMRDPALAEDAVTLDPVIHDAVERVEAGGEAFGGAFDLVLTIQPTSPLLRAGCHGFRAPGISQQLFHDFHPLLNPPGKPRVNAVLQHFRIGAGGAEHTGEP